MIVKYPVDRALVTPFLLMLSVFPAAAEAQTADAEQVLEEIIVTAQKRTENAQDVPISVSAISGDNLEKAGISNLEDAAFRLPNLAFPKFSDSKLASVTLRGISDPGGSAGQDPGVAVYMDEVYLGPGVGSNIDYFDLESVEVLRGPQGTLFGRNAIGGVINLRSRKPTFDWEGFVSAGYGNYNAQTATAAVSGPLLGDKLAVRLAGTINKRDGTTRNEFLKADTNSQGSGSARLQLLFRPNDQQEWSLSGEYRRLSQSPKGFETLFYDPAGVVSALFSASRTAPNNNPFDRKIVADGLGRETANIWRFALNGVVELGDLTLHSVTSYRKHDYYSFSDTDNSPFKIAYDGDPENVKAFSQEVRLESDKSERFDWMVGGFYYHQNARNLSFVTIGSDATALLTEGALTSALNIGSNAKTILNSYAGFANIGFRPTDKTELRVGARYSSERKKLDYSQVDLDSILGRGAEVLGGTFTANRTTKSSSFTPSISLTFKPVDDVMVYAAVSKGFKSGGFNDGLGTVDSIAFGPEKLWNYEAGLKSELFGRRVRFNVTGFYMQWTDIQISNDDPATPFFDPKTSNAGKARSYGLEVELTGKVNSFLTIGSNLGLLDARYTNGFFGALSAVDGKPILLRKLPYAPTYSFSLFADFNKDISDRFKLSLRPEMTLQGPHFLSDDQRTAAEAGERRAPKEDNQQMAYALVNVRAGFGDADDRWQISVWAQNLFNKTYKTRIFNQLGSPLIAQKFIILGEPRTYGVEARFKF